MSADEVVVVELDEEQDVDPVDENVTVIQLDAHLVVVSDWQ